MSRKNPLKRLIRVKVSPGAKREDSILNTDGSYAISVREEAKNGRANKRVKEILNGLFATEPGVRIIMVKGGRSESKIYEIISNITLTKNEN